MRHIGIKASELVTKLQQLIKQHGDREVIVSGGDYPEGCRGVWLVTKRNSNAYTPEGTFKIG